MTRNEKAGSFPAPGKRAGKRHRNRSLANRAAA
jgi:hypothetical protein